MKSGVSAARNPLPVDGSRTRTVIMFQLFLAALIVLAAGLSMVSGLVLYPALLVGTLALTFITCSAALLLRWNDLPSWLVIALPGLDAVTIGLLRASSPEAGLEMLWAFPAIWVAWSFSVAATIITVSLIAIASWVQNAVSMSQSNPLAALLVPLTIAVLAAVAQLMSRRVNAQRALLQRQSRSLQSAVERSHRQEALVTDVLDAVDFEVVVYAADGAPVMANEAHSRLEQVRHRAGEATYTADGLTHIAADALPMARAGHGETFEDELHWYGEPGQDRRALQTTARRLVDWRGENTGTVVVTQDVTAQMLAVRAREDLVASVSHELRTPLTSITGFLELAADTPDLPERTRRGLQIAERNAERLLDLVADILTASASAGEGIALTVDPEPGQLADVVLAAVDAAQESLTTRHMTIDTTGVESTRALIDSHRIRQVMDNLISNAVKYGHDGGRIDVGTTSDGVHAWIVVRDDGAGVSTEELPFLFDRFFRSDGVRKSTTHGSGLGLAISREIIRAHGGDISVTSPPGEGTTFLIRLPIPEEVRDVQHHRTEQVATLQEES